MSDLNVNTTEGGFQGQANAVTPSPRVHETPLAPAAPDFHLSSAQTPQAVSSATAFFSSPPVGTTPSFNSTQVNAGAFFNSPPPDAKDNIHVVHSPAPTTTTYTDKDVSPTNPIGEVEAHLHMIEDEIKEQPFYKEADNETKKMLDRCFFFLYGRNFYQKAKNDDEPSPFSVPKETRVQIITKMLRDNKKIMQLNQLASRKGDRDLTKNAESKEQYNRFVKSLWRFLAREKNVRGFAQDMKKITYSYLLRLQSWGNCFLVIACLAYSMDTKCNPIIPRAKPEDRGLALAVCQNLITKIN